MLFEVENQSPIENADAAELRSVIRKLRSYGPCSHASLTDAKGSDLVVAGGGVTCLLEWRDAVNRRHYRAHLDAPSQVFPDGTILGFGGGEVKLQADEWLMAPMVVDAFLAFLKGGPLPAAIRRRDISAMFDNLA